MPVDPRTFRLGSLLAMRTSSHFYFRFGHGQGRGLWFAIRARRSLIPFSERYGYARVWHVGPLDMKLLEPSSLEGN